MGGGQEVAVRDAKVIEKAWRECYEKVMSLEIEYNEKVGAFWEEYEEKRALLRKEYEEKRAQLEKARNEAVEVAGGSYK